MTGVMSFQLSKLSQPGPLILHEKLQGLKGSNLSVLSSLLYYPIYLLLDTERYSPQLPYREEIITVTIEGDHRERIKDLSIKQGRHSLIRRDVVWVHKVKSGSAADRALLVKVWVDYLVD